MLTEMNRQNKTSISEKHTHSKLRLVLQHTVKTSAVSFTADCLLGSVYLQHLSHSLLLCSAAIWAWESQILWENAHCASIQVCVYLSHLCFSQQKQILQLHLWPISKHLFLPCHFLSLSCPWIPPHPPWLPWRWWWGMPAWPVGGGWVAVPSPHKGKLIGWFYGAWHQEVCVAWRIGGGRQELLSNPSC